ncbi:hypothetical protein EYR40_006302 [Pleurotus pulmonarius]|nr:hypothetical protein EYR36_010923 [Pleurotus pulmonarius]KAF4599212.1 hypothetical protein EYR40_006302 [Pleurotus pulmonarius]
MAPSNLQGLNIVHPMTSDSDSQDLIPPYPELAAQLDLWANITFDNEETQPHGHIDDRRDDDEGDDEGARGALQDASASRTNGGNNVGSIAAAPAAPPFQLNDISAFLSGFGMAPFPVPPSQPQAAGISPSLVQLLAMQAALKPQPTIDTQSHVTTTSSATSFSASPEEAQPAKRARTRKTSIDSPISEAQSPISTGPLSAAEDKRRRNTAASARFRLKKKEREAALEGKAKELETRVNELEKECEGLRRENGWLKGLVVGVTGAAAGPVPVPTMESVAAGLKRPRDEISTDP